MDSSFAKMVEPVWYLHFNEAISKTEKKAVLKKGCRHRKTLSLIADGVSKKAHCFKCEARTTTSDKG